MSGSSLDKIDTLPPLPYVTHEILLAVNDGTADLRGIAAILSKEPGLTARIVAMANSAFFASQRPVYSVEDAVVRLGLNRVRVLSASILLAKYFDAGRCSPFHTERYWYDAVGTAFCAARLSRFLSINESGDAAYLAGLLHNIGLLLLVYVFPLEMANVLARRENDPDQALSALERQFIGTDHHEAGRLLLSEWGLPAEIVLVAGHSHEARYVGPHADLIEVVRFARVWTNVFFTEQPESPLADRLAPEALSAIGEACRREHDQLQAFARLLTHS